MGIKETARKIHEIRKAMGYSTKEQRAEGPAGELKFVEEMIKNLKKDNIINCGGFSFELSPSGKSVIIKPDFKFRHRI